MSDMNTIIENAMTEFMTYVIGTLPTIMKGEKKVDISDVLPIDLADFIKANDIPDNADFDGEENGYDGFTGRLFLSWRITIPATDKYRDAIKVRRFNLRVFRSVGTALMANGYNRISNNSGAYREFKNVSLYDMYIAGDFDKLARYYSLSFAKN